MALNQLDIQHFRNIPEAHFEFSPGLNLITGLNASGKTSLLEAVSIICQGRSFRTARIDQLISHGQSGFVVFARAQVKQETQTIGVSRESRKTRVKINGKAIARTTELVGHTPLFVLTPESHELLDSGPRMRRQYLDWGVFHVEHRYLDCWQKYHRILRQRNSALRKQASASEIQAWDSALVTQAEQLDTFRQQYLTSISPILAEYGQELIGILPEFSYQPGWNRSEGGLTEQIKAGIKADLERGFTRLGPHRADIKIKVDGKLVQNVFSRGQQKLLICAMTLAQQKRLGQDSILLIDDLPAELDPQRRAALLRLVKATGCQAFVTATEAELVNKIVNQQGWEAKKMFHVEHGKFE